MKVTGWACDECGKQKGTVNRWWLLWMDDTHFDLFPWEKASPTHDKAIHLCGQECVVKAVNKFMQEQMSAVQDTQKA